MRLNCFKAPYSLLRPSIPSLTKKLTDDFAIVVYYKWGPHLVPLTSYQRKVCTQLISLAELLLPTPKRK